MSAYKTLKWRKEHAKPVPDLAPELAAIKDQRWLIWSNEHCAWWAPGELGYTPDRAKAGRYTYDRDRQICEHANSNLNSHFPAETMCPDWECMPVY